MYKVYCGSDPLELNTNDVTLISAELKLADNEAGELTFQISPTHPYVDSIVNRVSIIYVYQDDEEIWRGTPIEITTDFFGVKKVVCQGELNYLVDSIQPPAEFHLDSSDSVRELLQIMVSKHNASMSDSDAHKIFRVGIVTVQNPDQILYRYTNWENTLEDILDKLVDRLGGHLRIRHVKEGNAEVNYLDYLQDFPTTSSQVVRFGHNLLDYSQDYDLNEIITRIIPLGATLEESPIEALDAYTTIESVNNGKVYLQNDAAIARYGIISRVVNWDDVNVPSILKTKAQQYLNSVVYDNIVLEVNAVDLANMGADVDKFRLLDQVRVISTPHGVDRLFPITKMTINLKSPSDNTLTLGISTRMTLTESTNAASTAINARIDELPSKFEILEEAKENATQLITSGALGSHVVVLPDEIYVMDTDDTETARKVWRFNVNGLGYSSNGINGPYGLAMTMDGQIVADRMTTGTLDASKATIINLNASNIKTGTLDASVVRIVNLMASNVELSGIFSSTSGNYSAKQWAALYEIRWLSKPRVKIYAAAESDGDTLGIVNVFKGNVKENGDRADSTFRRSYLTPKTLAVGSDGNGNFDGDVFSNLVKTGSTYTTDLYVSGKFRPRVGQNALYMDWIPVQDMYGNQQWVLAGFTEPVTD